MGKLPEEESAPRKHLVYKRPYEDKWGALHDPTTWWDELLKYYRHDATLLVSEACRRMAQPAHVEAVRLIRRGEARHRRNLKRAHQLEARYLAQKHHRRHRSKTNKSRAASRQRATATAQPNQAMR